MPLTISVPLTNDYLHLSVTPVSFYLINETVLINSKIRIITGIFVMLILWSLSIIKGTLNMSPNSKTKEQISTHKLFAPLVNNFSRDIRHQQENFDAHPFIVMGGRQTNRNISTPYFFHKFSTIYILYVQQKYKSLGPY